MTEERDEFCRCDHPFLDEDGVTCLSCRCRERQFDREALVHVPAPAFCSELRPAIAEKPPWQFCPACGCGPGVDHRRDCTRASWNNETYRARRLT